MKASINGHFSEAPPLQHLEVLYRFNHEQNSTTKEMVSFLTILNSNVATYNINPQLKTAHVTSVAVLLEAVIVHLLLASDKISEYQSFIWIARNIIHNYGDIQREQVAYQTQKFLGNINDGQSFFNECKEIFKALLPSKGLIDPGLANIVNLSVQQSREKIFLLFECFSKVFPAEEYAHPLLRYIHENLVKAEMAIQCLEEKQTKVYRSSHVKFDG